MISQLPQLSANGSQPAPLSPIRASEVIEAVREIAAVPFELSAFSAASIVQIVEVAAANLFLSNCANNPLAQAETCPSTHGVVQSAVDTVSYVLHSPADSVSTVGAAPITVRRCLRTVASLLATTIAANATANTSAVVGPSLPTGDGSTHFVTTPSLTLQVTQVPAASLANLTIRIGNATTELTLCAASLPTSERRLGAALSPATRLPATRRLETDTSRGVVIVVATTWAQSQWLPTGGDQPQSPPASPPPAPPPRDGCAGPSWLESGDVLGSDVTSVELLSQQDVLQATREPPHECLSPL